jgi:hypothetical protein
VKRYWIYTTSTLCVVLLPTKYVGGQLIQLAGSRGNSSEQRVLKEGRRCQVNHTTPVICTQQTSVRISDSSPDLADALCSVHTIAVSANVRSRITYETTMRPLMYMVLVAEAAGCSLWE